jgi:hypothetical protein
MILWLSNGIMLVPVKQHPTICVTILEAVRCPRLVVVLWLLHEMGIHGFKRINELFVPVRVIPGTISAIDYRPLLVLLLRRGTRTTMKPFI